MRLYIIASHYRKGGAGVVAADLYDVAKEEGWDSRFAYSRGTIPKDINCYHIGNVFTTYLHAATSMIFDNAGFTTQKSTLDLINDIEKFKPDLINLHNPLGYSMNVQILFDYFKRSGVKVVWTLHDVWSITGHCYAGMCNNWDNGCGDCPRKKEYPSSYVLDRSRRNRILKEKTFGNVPNMRIITPSKWLSELALRTYLSQYRIDIINNGIDLDIFKPIDSDLRKKYYLTDKIVLLFVANNWTDSKGIKYIYKLAEKVDDRFVFVIIGRIKKRYKKEDKRIIYIENTSDRIQLAKWYSMADIFINPTLADNFPTVNLEAIACGTPVVTFDTGGSGEAINNCGVVVPKRDVDEMINGIKLLLNRDLKNNCIKNAQLYSKKIKYEQYLKIFNDIVDNK